MRWIVGIDLHERSGGAVQMAAWLREHSRQRPGSEHTFVGVHVLDDGIRRSAKVVSHVIASAEREMQRIAEYAGVANPFETLQVVLGASPEEALDDAVTTGGFDGLLLGRAAPADARSMRRLGRVTRRLLRLLPAPIMVAPPYLTRQSIGGGSIVVATEMGACSESAARFARRLGRELDRGIEVVHVDRGMEVAPSIFGQGAVLVPIVPRTTADLETWAYAQGLDSARARILHGTMPDIVIAEAQIRDAPLVVCGSRRLSVVERIFSTSVGSELARWADRAVLVVPARPGD